MGDSAELGVQQETTRPKIKFTRDYSVAVPRGEKAYMIPASEWDRIKRMITRIVPAKNWFLVAGSICSGICVSAVFCLIGFAASKDVPTWAKAVGWSAAICAFVLGGGLFYLDSQQRSDIAQSTADVTHEMEQLEKLCQESESDVPAIEPQVAPATNPADEPSTS